MHITLPVVSATRSFPVRLSIPRLRLGLALGGAAALLLFCVPSTRAQIWNLGGGGSWGTAANWNPASVPNAVGAGVTFNGAATGSNPAQTGNRAVTLDGARTVGSIIFNNDLSTFTDTISTGTGGPLTFDEVGTGPATITTMGAGTGNNTISVAMIFNDTVVGIVNNTSASSAAGSLNLTGTIGGAGGFTKNGDGLATFGTGAKTYTGATVLNGGRLRSSSAAAPTATSSFTINAGGQLDIISSGTFSFGSGPLNLNGAGPTSGPFAPFPGAIRPDTSLIITINNAVVLQSDTVLHMQGSATGSLTLGGSVSGAGKLTAGAIPHDANVGAIVLSAANSYTGGTVVEAGTLDVSGALATLGTADVAVHSANLAFAGSSAKLKIETGVLNAIADTATLSLAGGGTAGVADDGYADLGLGVNDLVAGLVLGGVAQGPGTYGSTGSAALFQSDEYFTGAGIITVVPEPSAAALLLAACGALLGMRRFGRKS
jgi:autotransporter-associated beta strand protein